VDDGVDPECDRLIVVAAIGIVGALIGSFLNVVIYRVPLGRSVVAPASACGQCGHPIRWYDNIPVVSWVLLRGRCRDCGAHISVRYPLVELAGGVAFVFVALRFLPGIATATTAPALIAGILALAGYLYFVAISLALALIDLDTQRLPNVLVLPSYAVAAATLGASSIIGGSLPALLPAAVGGAGLFLAYLALASVRRGGMGFGDVKLAGAIGIYLGWLGWDVLAVGALAAFILGGVFGVILLVSRSAGRKTAVPFGPWMLGGAWVGILGGHEIAVWYLGLFGLGAS
jgi:leader peptidase (prepilin peptidase) / N-methyltransferase